MPISKLSAVERVARVLAAERLISRRRKPVLHGGTNQTCEVLEQFTRKLVETNPNARAVSSNWSFIMRNGATENPSGRDAIIKGKQRTERKVDSVPEDDPHKVEKLIKIGRSDIDPDAGSD